MALIAVSELGIGVAGRDLIHGIDLALAPRQIIAVLGPNGVGKSTFFRTLLRLQPARSGSILLDGAQIAHLSRAEIARKIAFVPQTVEVPFPLTALDFVVMGRTSYLGVLAAPSKADFRKAEDALDNLGILHLTDRPVTRLSGGERQLVLIARALAQGAPTILLDEPASALDFANRERLAEVLKDLATQGKGLIFSTHDPGQAARLASQVLCLFRSGEVRLLPVGEALAPDTLARLYGMTVEAVLQGLAVS